MCYRQTVYEGKSEIDPGFYYYILGNKYTDLFACFCIKDGVIYIGTTFKLTNKKNDFLNNLHDKLKAGFNLQLGKTIRTEACISDDSPEISRFNFGKGNVLLAGESTGLLTNFGEGITSALISGKIAAESVERSLETNFPAYGIYSKAIEVEKTYIWQLFSGEKIVNPIISQSDCNMI
jgi:flavin-dependent dehydrogenase